MDDCKLVKTSNLVTQLCGTLLECHVVDIVDFVTTDIC